MPTGMATNSTTRKKDISGVLCRCAVASGIISSKQLLNATLPDRGSVLARDFPHENLRFRRIARRSAIDHDLVAVLQCESGHSAFRKLRDTAPFTTPARHLTVLAGDCDTD